MLVRPIFSVSALAASLTALALGASGSAQALVITVNAANCATYSSSTDPTTGNVTIGCATTTPPPPSNVAPSGCSLSAPASAAVGDIISVSARCTAGAPVDFQLNWTGPTTGSASINQAATGGSATASVGPVALGTYTFSATASNTVGAATNGVNGASVAVTAAAPPPPPSTGAISCASQGFAATRVINLKWGALKTGNVNVLTSSVGSWHSNEALVVAFTTPSVGANGKIGTVSVYEYAGAPAYKTATLSAQPCDFGKGMGQGESMSTAAVLFSVGTNTWGAAQLQPNQTYYLNVVTRQNGIENCFGTCDARIELSKPAGL